MLIKLQRTALQYRYKFLKTLRPGGIPTLRFSVPLEETMTTTHFPTILKMNIKHLNHYSDLNY
jgi:hypothetical protein